MVLAAGFDRFQPRSHGPGQPSLPTLTRPCAVDIMPQLHGHFLDSPRSGRLQRAGTQSLEVRLLLTRHVGRVSQPIIFGSLEVL